MEAALFEPKPQTAMLKTCWQVGTKACIQDFRIRRKGGEAIDRDCWHSARVIKAAKKGVSN